MSSQTLATLFLILLFCCYQLLCMYYICKEKLNNFKNIFLTYLFYMVWHEIYYIILDASP